MTFRTETDLRLRSPRDYQLSSACDRDVSRLWVHRVDADHEPGIGGPRTREISHA
jgi:hypothetical protein